MTRARWSVILLALSTLVAVPAAAAAPTWENAQRVLLPAGATGLSQGYLPSLSCPDATNCATTGIYSDTRGGAHALVASEVAGHWERAREVNAPPDGASTPSVTPYAISCASAGDCAIVGSYLNSSGSAVAFSATEVNRTWHDAQAITLPSNAATTGQNAQLRAVVCESPGTCSAVGTYLEASTPLSHTVAMTVDEVHGVWRGAQSLALPTGLNVDPQVTLSNLACASPGNCAASGSYLDANNVTRGLLVNEVASHWSATTLLEPTNASPYALAQVSSLACARPGFCTAIGTYETADGLLEGFTVDERGATWSRAMMMRLPVAASVNPHVFFYGYGGISCPSVGNCATGGQYRDATGTYQGFVINEVSGVWAAATRVVLPAGASAGHNGGVVALACASAGTCRAGAAYLDAHGNYQALTLSEVGNVWGAGQRVSLPGDATSVGVDGGVYAMTCTAQNHCTGVGSYLASPTTYQGFTISGH